MYQQQTQKQSTHEVNKAEHVINKFWEKRWKRERSELPGHIKFSLLVPILISFPGILQFQAISKGPLDQQVSRQPKKQLVNINPIKPGLFRAP